MAQEEIKQAGTSLFVNDKGVLTQMQWEQQSLPFAQNEKAGPRFYLVFDGKETKANWARVGEGHYRARIGELECEMRYRIDAAEQPCISFTLTNSGVVPIQPEKAGIKLGIDTYMDRYPQWFKKYFPTLLRCEKTHFLSYFQSPSEQTVAVFCPQPIASWSIDYNKGYMDPPPHWFMGHRIDSVNLGFINRSPLPERHPTHLYQIKQGESKTWDLHFVALKQLADFEAVASAQLQAPILRLHRRHVPLINAFVIELEGGQLKGYGCQLSRDEATGAITVIASEDSITKFHYNLKTPCKLSFQTAKGDKKEQQITSPQMGWL